MAYQNIKERLNVAEMALENALQDDAILAALGQCGYDQARLEAGQALLEAARAAYQSMQADYGLQYAATDAFRTSYARAQATYMRHLRLARVAFRTHRGPAQKLDLFGKRERTASGWLEQVRQFYTNALADADVLAVLGEYGITPEALQAGLDEVNAAGAARALRARRRGAAQSATERRDEALRALDEWVRDFLDVARVALETDPQWLEKLGLVT